MEKLFFIIGILTFSFQGNVNGQYSERTQKHISHWSSKEYFSLELTVDLNPKFITNWEFNLGVDMNPIPRLRANFSYQQLSEWIEVAGGFDCSFWNPSLGKLKLDIRGGGKIGADNESYFASVLYSKEEIRLKEWKNKGAGYEKGTCKPRCNSINLVLYQNLCKNSRREGKFYFELRGGLNFKF
jgi:hypothetical protein